MADKSLIEWTDATWNIITGCTLVDEGCRHCYAAHLIANWPALGNHPSRQGLARNNAAGEAKFTGEVRFNEQWLDQPLRWKKPRKIFVCAHGDLFHENVPDAWIDRVFAVMALCPQHTFQVLTKRPDRARAYLSDPIRPACVLPAEQITRDSVAAMKAWPLPNVWLGTSISDQASADLRIPELLATPAAIRFVSAEPLLGLVDLQRWLGRYPIHMAPGGNEGNPSDGWIEYGDGIAWAIVGGESGPKARPMHPDWARSIRDQCKAAGTAFLFKQWGGYQIASHENGHFDSDMSRNNAVWVDGADGTIHKPSPFGLMNPYAMFRVGKARAGRLLDGVTHDEFPGVR